MAAQANNLVLLDLTTGRQRTIDTGNDSLELGVALELTGTSSLTVGGDLTVNGTMITNQQEEVLLGDAHLVLNHGYTSESGVTSGFVAVIDPDAAVATTVNGVYTAGVAATSEPTVVTTDSAEFTAGDIIQISSSTNNNGLYEVLTHVGTTLTIRGVGDGNPTIHDHSLDDFTAGADDSAVITKVGISIMRAKAAGGWEQSYGATTTDLTTNFADVTTGGSLTLDDVYENGNEAGTNSSSGAFLISGDQKLQVTASGGLDIDGPATFDGTTFAVNMSGAIDIESSAGTIDIGANDVDQAINIGTNGERVITIGNSDGVTGVAINSGSGNIVATAAANNNIRLLTTSSGLLSLDSDVPIQSAAPGVTFDAAATVTATGAALTLQTSGSGDVDIISAGEIKLDANGGGLDADFAGNAIINFDSAAVTVAGHAWQANAGQGGAASSGAGGTGGGVTWGAGQGGSAVEGEGAAGAGGLAYYQGGSGGDGSATTYDGGTGGNSIYRAGPGGDAGASTTGGTGGTSYFEGGGGGAAGAGTGGDGGDAYVRGGNGVNAGDLYIEGGIGATADGAISIGAANTTSIAIATSGVTTTIQGGLTLSNAGLTAPDLDLGATGSEIGDTYTNGFIRFGESAGDPSNVTDKGFIYTKDDGGDTELFYLDAAGNAVQLTKDGALNGDAVTGLSLDGAYNGGSVITVDTGAVAWNSSLTGNATEITCSSNTMTGAALDISFTGTVTTSPDGIVVDFASMTSLNVAEDAYGINMLGETNANGGGDSVAINIDAAWDQGIENASTLVQTGSSSLTGTNVDINPTGDVTIDSSGGDILIGYDSDNGDIYIGYNSAAGRDLYIGSSDGTSSVEILTGTGAFVIDASGSSATNSITTGSGAFNFDCSNSTNVNISGGSAATNIDSASTIEINSSGGAIRIGNDADTGNISVGASASARTVTVGNINTTTALNLWAGTGDIDLQTTGGCNIQAADDSTWAIDANSATALTIKELAGDDYLVFDTTAAPHINLKKMMTVEDGAPIGVALTADAGGVSQYDIVHATATAGEVGDADASSATVARDPIGVAMNAATSAACYVATMPGSVVKGNFDSNPAAGDNGKVVYLDTTAGQVTIDGTKFGSGDTIFKVGILIGGDGAANPEFIWMPQHIADIP